MDDNRKALLAVENLSVSFGPDQVIGNLSFTVRERDILVILGPNGAGKTTLLRALLFLGVGVLIIWYLEQKTKLHLEALTAVVFSTSLSIAFLFLPEEETQIALLGNVSQITLTTVAVTSVVAAVLWLTIKMIYADMVLLGISSDLAQTRGIDVKRCNFIYLACIALAVALGVRIVGGLMTAALLAIPACTAKNLSQNLAHYARLSTLAGGLACVFGILLHAVSGVPVGPLIIIVSALFFPASIFARERAA